MCLAEGERVEQRKDEAQPSSVSAVIVSFDMLVC